jgi:hypothetical protein
MDNHLAEDEDDDGGEEVDDVDDVEVEPAMVDMVRV